MESLPAACAERVIPKPVATATAEEVLRNSLRDGALADVEQGLSLVMTVS